ncbi:MAG: hypothetical protein A2W90_06255 [Bacteroidetes bacterium GWF2_42_66]|nr:MAG: hypothetical protein A2W92_17770 [Bacteroidetes bacterium GWA2_42_15]OFX97042.1 MAG: hypothetical protein A2W89_03920 [Bacteroidetes bacterium GWE2_42_39]OFY46154.1 MAG: hypothetical protein A2W90_06255 [Bacteroidetes bacterium GWF2_42_66]HBL75663.1 hypothetical protein [Prolixibacteraceae bacterium]HCR91123.1 hypothetical protein [Prolixibacteraceae bacterium]
MAPSRPFPKGKEEETGKQRIKVIKQDTLKERLSEREAFHVLFFFDLIFRQYHRQHLRITCYPYNFLYLVLF